jgi:hypothetical protein
MGGGGRAERKFQGVSRCVGGSFPPSYLHRSSGDSYLHLRHLYSPHHCTCGPSPLSGACEHALTEARFACVCTCLLREGVPSASATCRTTAGQPLTHRAPRLPSRMTPPADPHHHPTHILGMHVGPRRQQLRHRLGAAHPCSLVQGGCSVLRCAVRAGRAERFQSRRDL